MCIRDSSDTMLYENAMQHKIHIVRRTWQHDLYRLAYSSITLLSYAMPKIGPYCLSFDMIHVHQRCGSLSNERRKRSTTHETFQHGLTIARLSHSPCFLCIWDSVQAPFHVCPTWNLNLPRSVIRAIISIIRSGHRIDIPYENWGERGLAHESLDLCE